MIKQADTHLSARQSRTEALECLRDRFAQLRSGLAESGKSGDVGSLYIRTCVLADMCEQLCSHLLAAEGPSAAKPHKAT